MIGFDNRKTEGPREGALAVTKFSDMTRHDIQRRVARAHRLRAEQLGQWGRKMAQMWASVFRRPGRLLPTHARSRDRLVSPAEV
jgi:hypothetical protein